MILYIPLIFRAWAACDCALKNIQAMKSVKPFFTPAAKKVKYCEGETLPTAEGEGIGEASTRRSDLSDKGLFL